MKQSIRMDLKEINDKIEAVINITCDLNEKELKNRQLQKQTDDF